MPQINTSLPEEMIRELQKISDETTRSLSGTMKLMIEYGLEVYKNMSGKEEKKKSPKEQDSENIIKILGITSDILRCVYDKEKSKYEAKNANEVLKKIEEKAQEFFSKK